MAAVTLFDAAGAKAGSKDLPDEVFGTPVYRALIQQSVLRQLGNARRANPSTLTKGDVRGGGRKPWRQKGTGRARQGSTRNPHWRGGGVAHGPDGRDYSRKMNRKARRKAMASLLSDLVKSEKLSVIQAPKFEAPKTKQAVALIEALGFAQEKVLFVVPSSELENFERSVKNLPRAKTLKSNLLNPHDLMSHTKVVLVETTIDGIVDQLTRTGRQATEEVAQ